MDLCDYAQITALLRDVNFHFSKARGQNFLTAAWVPARMAEVCGADAHTGVVEIGPGVGCLTEQLSTRAAKVVSYEIDTTLKPVLARTLARRTNVEIIFDDVLQRDLGADVTGKLAGLRRVVCASLPYNVTTPLLRKLYETRCFDTITVMVQWEVAMRMTAAPGTSDYGAFTLLTAWYAVPELLFPVEAACFVPRPQVRSAVVRLQMRREPPADVAESAFFAVVRAVFQQRRKTLQNALSALCGRERAAAVIASCALDPRVRGEKLSLSQFAALASCLGIM